MMSDFGIGRQYCQNWTSYSKIGNLYQYKMGQGQVGRQVKKQAKKYDIIYGWPFIVLHTSEIVDAFCGCPVRTKRQLRCCLGYCGEVIQLPNISLYILLSNNCSVTSNCSKGMPDRLAAQPSSSSYKSQRVATRFIHRNMMKKITQRKNDGSLHWGTCEHFSLTNWKSNVQMECHINKYIGYRPVDY